MFLYFRSFSRIHGRTSLERSLSTNLPEKEPQVSTTRLPNDFHEFSIPFRIQTSRKFSEMASHMSSSLLIPKNFLRRNNNVFTSVICNTFHLISRNPTWTWSNRVLSSLRPSYMTGLLRGVQRLPTHQTRKPFYITPFHQENHASQENYASESHQVMIMCLLKMDPTSCEKMVILGRVHFKFLFLLCMKN